MSRELAKSIFGIDDPKAVIFVVHGMQEHRRRYQPFAQAMNRCGYAVITYDLPGHGDTDTGADRGWFGGRREGWGNLINSAVEMAEFSKNEYPDIPVIYFGHSMGTMIGRSFLQENDDLISAMILSGPPAYNPAAAIGRTLARGIAMTQGRRNHSALLDNMATGSFNNGIENPRTKLDWLSYNEKNVDDYIADPDCGFSFTNQGYYDLFYGMTRMHDPSKFKHKNTDLPLYLFAGEDDPCIGGTAGFNSTIEALRTAGYHNIDSKLYPNKRHETLNEDGVEEIYKDIDAWISAHVL